MLLEKPKIDSFRVMIPMSTVTIRDHRITEGFIKFYPSVDIVDEEISEAKPLTDEVNGITSRYYRKTVIQGNYHEDCLVIQVNAKMLKEQYFKGITKDTINQIYEFIISENKIYIDERTFLNAFVADVDICIDYKLSPKLAIEVVNRLNFKTLNQKYICGFNRSLQHGVSITYNSRERASPTAPHVKLYHKTLELLNEKKEKNVKFVTNYLKDIDFNDLVRLEYTIKNYKQRQRLGIQYKSLKELLELKSDVLRDVVLSGIPNYIKARKVSKKPSGMKATDLILYAAFERMIEEGAGEHTILNLADIIDEPAQRSRWRKRIKNLLELQSENEVLERNTKVENFFSKLNL